MEHSPPVTHIYRFGRLFRGAVILATCGYAAFGLFVAVKACSEILAVGLLGSVTVSATSLLILYVVLYPRLIVDTQQISCRMPLSRRDLAVSNIQGVGFSRTTKGRVTHLVPRDQPAKTLRIHPYFETDRFFAEWLARFPAMGQI